jgi:amidohydrolase
MSAPENGAVSAMNTAPILAYIRSLQDDMIRWRREIHRHPELMYDVARTAAFVGDLLSSWGLEVERNVGRHFGRGVTAVLRGGRPGTTLLLRADMDALPIREENDVPYRSTVEGAMHACGHDAHTAMLLGAARALSRFREELPGIVKFVFQPAEEGAAASPVDGVLRSGGADMIEAGILEGVERCFALHVWPELEAGVIGIHRDYVMAASTHFRVVFHGRPGHHSRPHAAADAIMMAAHWIMDMKAYMSTAVDPLSRAVLAFGTLRAGTVINAIADRSEIGGTYRAFEPHVVDQIREAIEHRSRTIAALYGGSAESAFRMGTALRNDPLAAAEAMEAGRSVFGPERTIELDRPSLAGEDFAFYAKEVPSAMGLLGIRNAAKGYTHPLHHPKFDVDEDVLKDGASWFVEAIRAFYRQRDGTRSSIESGTGVEGHEVRK